MPVPRVAIACFALAVGVSGGCRFGYEELESSPSTGGTSATGAGSTGAGATGGATAQGGASAGQPSGSGGSGTIDSGGDAGAATNGGSSAGGGSGGSATGGTDGSGGSATGGSATGGTDGSGGSAGSSGCSPTNGGVEICDGLDNDCAGGADDGVTCPAMCSGIAYDGNGYMFCGAQITRQEASDACAAQGMHLVKIDDAAENSFVATTAFAMSDAFVWLGGDDLTTEDSWHWQDGSLFWTGTSSGSAPAGVETFWYFTQPGGNGDCMELRMDTTWDDVPCNLGKRYVCELLY